MDIQEYQRMYNAEDNHWWFVGNRKIVFTQIDKIVINKRNKILDVGCGTGITLKCLERYGLAIGVDLSEEALKFCRLRGHKKLCLADSKNLPFKINSFDIVNASNLLEHLDDDDIALQEFFRILKPNGILVVTVPAFEFLWSGHDEVLHHKRRYTKQSLERKIKKYRFQRIKESYTNFFIFPVVFLIRKIKKKADTKEIRCNLELFKGTPVVNKILGILYILEAKLLRIINFPFGISLIYIAKKGRTEEQDGEQAY